MALIREGNANAFEAVYDRHYRAILSFCRHMLGCSDEAEDAVQHTFLAAYNDLVASRKPIRLRAWLFTIARNRCLSILRARRERTALEFEEQATDGLAVQVQRRQDLRDLVVDINHLPDDQRAALVLAEMGALSHDEIGTVIGVPKDKVKALIFQARESLLADRAARDADCREIREQLSTMRGAALRRTTLRRHLRECEGCREYRHDLERQRRRIAAILPVAPTIALREAVIGVTASGGVAGAGVAGSGLLGASSLLKGVAGKALIGALLAAAGTTGTILVVHDFRLHAAPTPLQDLRGSTSTSALGATTAHLAPGSPTSAPGRAAPYVTTGAAGRAGLRSSTGIGHETAGAKALAHALTGQLSNLLSPVWPHEKLIAGGGAVPPRAAQSPSASPIG
ncbi:MAG TPA: RNA polymerase sigma factor, partial [Solirubrobacteraceae bacterium]